jgi:hypothetical protein
VRRSRRRGAAALLAGLLAAVPVACSSGDDTLDLDLPPTASGDAPASTADTTDDSSDSTSGSTAPTSAPADLELSIDAGAPGEEISPLILGVSSTLTADEFERAGLQVNSWGGNPATRYNYEIGHAWNHGADFEFRNTNYGNRGDAARSFLDVSAAAGIENRVAVPILGWVARDDLNETCSFPDGQGGCLARDAVGDCSNPQEQADPQAANVESTPEGVAEWIAGLVADGYDLRFIAMDNEPELWGGTHYDVHPECPTYEEILDKYLAYARAVREVAPDAELAGPVMCCWFDYWRTAPGPSDGSGEEFLAWFLRNVAEHDAQYGQRTLDVVDVHYYPQSGVFNEDTDDETNARRLRSTRSLWDPDYRDESWIAEPIRFIPRMKETIEETYPGTPLFISEWNFGADTTINGAQAIADVLGIYGREGVYAASYWRNPEVGSPGFFAFTMHGNYDGEGTRFGGRVLPVQNPEDGELGAYAALDEGAGVLRVMLINKLPDEAFTVGLAIEGVSAGAMRTYSYGPDDLERIVVGEQEATEPVALPASSITVVEIELA